VDDSKFETLVTVWSKTSVTGALWRDKKKSWWGFVDYDCCRKNRKRWAKQKAKNSKAKHKKKFKRR